MNLHVHNQMAPTHNSAKEDIKVGSKTTRTRNNAKSGKMMKQSGEGSYLNVTSLVWQKSGRCPEGTIPIRRIQ